MTALKSSRNPSSLGQTVTFTATVTSLAGTPSGTVTFRDSATAFGTRPLSGGVAAISTALVTPGTHHISAEYSASGNFGGSASGALVQVVYRYLFLPAVTKLGM
jgi:hypothetical protein